MRVRIQNLLSAGLMCGALLSASIASADVTGNPFADGWTGGGNSLASGVYVQGAAGYNFDTYSATLTVGSTLQDAATIGGGWQNGDTVVGVGGVFTDAAAANALADIKIQAKFGAAGSAWLAASTGTPNSSLSHGGDGAMEVKSSSIVTAADWNGGLGVADGNVGQPGVIHLTTGTSDPIDRLNGTNEQGFQVGGNYDTDVFRLIWTASPTGLLSWEILLDTSLLKTTLDGLGSPFSDVTPATGNQAILTVQQGNGAFTDALVQVAGAPAAAAPEPTSLVAWSLLGLAVGGVGWRRRKRSAI